VDRIGVDGGEFELPVWLPEGGTGPGIVLIQEIFGLDDHLRSAAADLAALGYVVAVPELFWRVRRHWAAGHDEDGVRESMEVAGRFDAASGVADVLASVDHLRGLPEVTGGVGVFGFCLGGSLAFAAAARAAPDVAVSFYGSDVPSSIALLADVGCPIQFHFGGRDPYIPRDDVQRVVDAVAGHDGAEIHVQEQAGHAFCNASAPRFHDPEASEAAWTLTRAFLARELPVR
jgi:carboxymethylenebutenolidase